MGLDQDKLPQSLLSIKRPFSSHHFFHPGDAHSFCVSSLHPHLLHLTLSLATECGIVMTLSQLACK